MAHNRIFEVRKAKPFSPAERANGVMDEAEVAARHQRLIDYIVDMEGGEEERQREVSGILMPLIDRVFSRDGDKLTLSQEGYDSYVEIWLSNISYEATDLTPWGVTRHSQYRMLERFLPTLHLGDVYIYDEEEGDILGLREWLLKTSVYRDAEGEGREFYLGKVWDYHY